MDFVDISSTVGLVAMVLLTVNILLGLLVSVNYNTAKQWPHRKLPVPLFKIHNWTAYVAIAAVILHPLLILFQDRVRFTALDVLWPLQSPGQRLYNILGGAAFYGFLLVVITSYFRPKLGYRPWKKLHYTAYVAAAFLYVHGALIDQNLKNQPPDFLDGEKVLVEGCFLLVAAASIWRWRYGSEKKRWAARKP